MVRKDAPGNKARIRREHGGLLTEEGKVWAMGEPEQGYFLYVNQQKILKFLRTWEEVEEEATPHLQSQAELKIETTWGKVRTWNYRYDLKQWVEMMRG